jgi:hypothetical protein
MPFQPLDHHIRSHARDNRVTYRQSARKNKTFAPNIERMLGVKPSAYLRSGHGLDIAQIVGDGDQAGGQGSGGTLVFWKV